VQGAMNWPLWHFEARVWAGSPVNVATAQVNLSTTMVMTL